MTTTSINYGTSTALTCTLASLATSSTTIVGRESASITNTSTLAVWYKISLRIKAGTSPTAAKQIEVWLADSEDGTNYDGAQTGSDAAMTHTAESKASLKYGAIQPTANTTGKVYNFSFDVLILPGRKMNLFISHNMAVNLDSTGGNHAITYTAIKADSA